MRRVPSTILAAALVLAGCSSTPEGRFEGLGPHKRPSGAASAEAQEWFDQGLERSLRAQGKTAEAEAAAARFGKIWAGADIDVNSSCLCLPAKK